MAAAAPFAHQALDGFRGLAHHLLHHEHLLLRKVREHVLGEVLGQVPWRMPTRMRGNSSLPSTSMMERRPLWPAVAAPLADAERAQLEGHVVEDDEEVLGAGL